MKIVNMFKAKKLLLVCILCSIILIGCASSYDYERVQRSNNILREAWCEDNHFINIVQETVTAEQWRDITKEYRKGILSNKSGCAFDR